MHRDIKITGDNPYYISYRDWRLDDPNHTVDENDEAVVVRWTIKRHPCLQIEVVPIVESAKSLMVDDVIVENGRLVGRDKSKRNVPQKIKVTLHCDSCASGQQTATVILSTSRNSEVISSWGNIPVPLSIICVSPDGSEDEVIRRVDYIDPEVYEEVSNPAPRNSRDEMPEM